MASKLKKMKSEMAKRLDEDNTTMTAYRDYDFDRRSTDMKRLAHALAHFDTAVTQGMVAMKEIASSFEAVGQAFTELTLGTVNTYSPGDPEEPAPFPMENEDLSAYNNENPETPDGSQRRAQRARSSVDPNESGNGGGGGGAASVASTRLTDETNSQVRRLAQMFAEETRRINEGQPFQSYNAGMHRDVVTRLLPVNEHLKAVEVYRHKRTEALERYNKYKSEVEKVEKQYAKKGKPFCDSKSHKKYAEKRDAAHADYVKARAKFNESFGLLMEVNDHAAAQIIHRYLALNDEYLRQLVASIGRILPAMADVYPLNQEYTTAQNSMIIEAVANARTPFAKHYEKQPESSEGEEETENDEEGDDGAAAAADMNSSMAPSTALEEPTESDEKDGGAKAAQQPQPQGPLLGDNTSAAYEPPHEDNEAVDSDDGGHVAAAQHTSEEPGYTLTQQSRLTTGGTVTHHVDPLPGQADP